MAKATFESTTPRLSQLFADPLLRRVFERAERDNGASFALPATPAPVLAGGEAAIPELV